MEGIFPRTMRPETARKDVPVATQEATGIGSNASVFPPPVVMRPSFS